MQYSSRMLQRHYQNQFISMIDVEHLNTEDTFVMLALAVFLARNDEFDALQLVADVVKHDAKQLMALNIIGDMLTTDLSAEDNRKTDVKALKSKLNKVRKWFRKHPDITKYLLDTTNPSLQSENTL